MNILIIPEDSRSDKYILKPIFEALFRTIGKPNANVRVCENPILQGVEQALRGDRINAIINSYRMVSIFILCVDRDGDENRNVRLRELEKAAPTDRLLLAEHAWEELETWLLAGMDLPPDWKWQDVRADKSVKENFFRPFSKASGQDDGPGGGRKYLGKMAGKNINKILQRCPELFDLKARLTQHT